MKKSHLFFPSGRSIERCRQDAKRIVKESKITDSPITLNLALDMVAKQNGVDLPWNKAIRNLEDQDESSARDYEPATKSLKQVSDTSYDETKQTASTAHFSRLKSNLIDAAYSHP